MRPSARASSLQLRRLHASRRRAGRSPAAARRAATSSAAARNARASVLEYWKRPVSVTRPTYSGVAIAGVSVTSEPREQLAHHHRGARRAVVDDVDVAEPRVVVVVVEVDHEVGALAHAVRQRRCGRPSRSRPRAAASRCRPGTVVAGSPSSSQRYSRGRSAAARTPTASMPAARRPRTAPTSEPMASPSGFSCAATTTRGAARSAAAAASYAASSSSLTLDARRHSGSAGGGSTRPVLGQQLLDADAVLERLVAAEPQHRRQPQVHLVVDPRWIDGRTRSSAARPRSRLRLVAGHLHVRRRRRRCRSSSRRPSRRCPRDAGRGCGAGSRRSPGAASRRRAAAAACASCGSWCVHRRHAGRVLPGHARGGRCTLRRSRSSSLCPSGRHSPGSRSSTVRPA